jgi:Domain of unknown function (DUF4133)
MNNSVYQINKSSNKPIEFKGLKAQYIWYLGGGLVILLIFFAVIYIIGINVFMCLAVIVSLATGLFFFMSINIIYKEAYLLIWIIPLYKLRQTIVVPFLFQPQHIPMKILQQVYVPVDLIIRNHESYPGTLPK